MVYDRLADRRGENQAIHAPFKKPPRRPRRQHRPDPRRGCRPIHRSRGCRPTHAAVPRSATDPRRRPRRPRGRPHRHCGRRQRLLPRDPLLPGGVGPLGSPGLRPNRQPRRPAGDRGDRGRRRRRQPLAAADAGDRRGRDETLQLGRPRTRQLRQGPRPRHGSGAGRLAARTDRRRRLRGPVVHPHRRRIHHRHARHRAFRERLPVRSILTADLQPGQQPQPGEPAPSGQLGPHRRLRRRHGDGRRGHAGRPAFVRRARRRIPDLHGGRARIGGRSRSPGIPRRRRRKVAPLRRGHHRTDGGDEPAVESDRPPREPVDRAVQRARRRARRSALPVRVRPPRAAGIRAGHERLRPFRHGVDPGLRRHRPATMPRSRWQSARARSGTSTPTTSKSAIPPRASPAAPAPDRATGGSN